MDRRLGHIEPQLDRAIGQHREDRRRRAGDLARVADHVVDDARRGRGQPALRQVPRGPFPRRVGARDGGFSRGDLLRPRRQPRHREIGLRLRDAGAGDACCRCRIIRLRRGRGATHGKALQARLGTLRLGKLGPGGGKRRLDHPDLLGPPPLAQVGELALRLRLRGLGLVQRDLGIAPLD